MRVFRYEFNDNGVEDSLTIENVSALMFVSKNGPPVEDFRPRPYVKFSLRDDTYLNYFVNNYQKHVFQCVLLIFTKYQS